MFPNPHSLPWMALSEFLFNFCKNVNLSSSGLKSSKSPRAPPVPISARKRTKKLLTLSSNLEQICVRHKIIGRKSPRPQGWAGIEIAVAKPCGNNYLLKRFMKRFSKKNHYTRTEFMEHCLNKSVHNIFYNLEYLISAKLSCIIAKFRANYTVFSRHKNSF